jgi:cytochrome c-type biogenesis protein CcmH
MPSDPLTDALVRPSLRLRATFASGVLVVAALGYSATGSPGRFGMANAVANNAADAGTPTPVAASPSPSPDDQMAGIVERLAQRLKEQPGDAAGWTLLARAYTAMGRYDDAVSAYKTALPLAGDSADLLADYADALAGQNNGKLNAEATRQIKRALVLEPGNPKALALSGRAAFDGGDYAGAVVQWEKVERALPPDSALMTPLRSSIAEARQLAGLPASRKAARKSPDSPTNNGAEAVSGTVSLAPALSARVSPDDTVFIVARDAEGGRQPLAVLRKKVHELPLDFTLDDSMAMAPNARISGHARITVSARISKSGDALPQPGDLAGQAMPVAPGTKKIDLRITELLENQVAVPRPAGQQVR